MVKLEVPLFEQDEQSRDEVPGGDNPIPMFVSVSSGSIVIEARDEHGNGFAVATVLVELYKGNLRLLLWDGATDNDAGDPSQKITLLEGARRRIEADSPPFSGPGADDFDADAIQDDEENEGDDDEEHEADL